MAEEEEDEDPLIEDRGKSGAFNSGIRNSSESRMSNYKQPPKAAVRRQRTRMADACEIKVKPGGNSNSWLVTETLLRATSHHAQGKTGGIVRISRCPTRGRAELYRNAARLGAVGANDKGRVYETDEP
jgi:hypothetical protein